MSVDGFSVYLHVTDGAETRSFSFPVRYAPGSASAIADGRTFTVDSAITPIDAAASGANLTFSYALSGAPAGLSINASTGEITGTPTTASSGTATITATDQYGRTYVDTFTYTASLRTQATGGADLDLSFPEDSAISSTNLIANWTANGNTLTFVSVSPTLPAGLSISSAGAMTGTPTTITADATYTLTMQDEYGRQTSDTFTLEITVAGPVLSAFGSGSIDDLELDPPAIFIEHNMGGTLTGDFHSSATPPAKEAGDIGFFTTTLTGDDLTDISTALNTFLDLHPSETGYLHFRLTNGTDSNVITTQVITVPAQVPSAFVDANWSVATGSGSGELDVTIATLPANNGAAISDVEYDLDASGTWISSGGTVSFTISGLTAATSYAVRLRAVNSAGNGAAGNSESATSGASAGFNPASLFGGSDNGFFYDFSDTSTLWQDTAATTAITADGQAIARVNDKSGKGNNATQGTAGNRPLYKTSGGLHWALSDGSDFMDVPLAFTSANVYVCIAFKPVSTNAFGRIFSFGEVGGNDFDSRSFCAVHRDDSTTSWLANRLNNVTPKVTIANGTAGVFEGVFESANTSAVLDGGTPVSASPGGSGNFATITARIFNYLVNTSFGVNAEVAAILVINRIPNSTERANLVTWMGDKQGRSI